MSSWQIAQCTVTTCLAECQRQNAARAFWRQSERLSPKVRKFAACPLDRWSFSQFLTVSTVRRCVSFQPLCSVLRSRTSWLPFVGRNKLPRCRYCDHMAPRLVIVAELRRRITCKSYLGGLISLGGLIVTGIDSCRTRLPICMFMVDTPFSLIRPGPWMMVKVDKCLGEILG